MKKRRIVIASVLKPVDDTRMYEKMGRALAESPDCQVYIIGQRVKTIPVHPNIQFITLDHVQRISFSRMLLPLKVGLKVIQVRPSLLIVNTPELLFVSIINRIIFGCRIVYDIRENYYRNIRFSETFPPKLRLSLARIVRLKERLTARLFHHFILAEKAYEFQLPFIKKRFTILENKAIPPLSIKKNPNPNTIRLLFSGTIAGSTGIFDAINLATLLNQRNSKITLTIVGYCALHEVRREIMKKVKDKPFIRLIGLKQIVQHNEIIEQIKQANFGIIYYPLSDHTVNCNPTKLYEYMAYQLPIITFPDQSYTQLVTQNQAGIIYNDSPDDLLNKMNAGVFYNQPLSDIFWEGDKLKSLTEQLLA